MLTEAKIGAARVSLFRHYASSLHELGVTRRLRLQKRFKLIGRRRNRCHPRRPTLTRSSKTMDSDFVKRIEELKTLDHVARSGGRETDMKHYCNALRVGAFVLAASLSPLLTVTAVAQSPATWTMKAPIPTALLIGCSYFTLLRSSIVPAGSVKETIRAAVS